MPFSRRAERWRLDQVSLFDYGRHVVHAERLFWRTIEPGMLVTESVSQTVAGGQPRRYIFNSRQASPECTFHREVVLQHTSGEFKFEPPKAWSLKREAEREGCADFASVDVRRWVACVMRAQDLRVWRIWATRTRTADLSLRVVSAHFSVFFPTQPRDSAEAYAMQTCRVMSVSSHIGSLEVRNTANSLWTWKHTGERTFLGGFENQPPECLRDNNYHKSAILFQIWLRAGIQVRTSVLLWSRIWASMWTSISSSWVTACSFFFPLQLRVRFPYKSTRMVFYVFMMVTKVPKYHKDAQCKSRSKKRELENFLWNHFESPCTQQHQSDLCEDFQVVVVSFVNTSTVSDIDMYLPSKGIDHERKQQIADSNWCR